MINNGSITTSSAGSPGLYTRTRHATIGNTIINTGAITTSGGTVTSSGRTSSGIRTESRENSTINNSGTITVNGAGGNGIEVMGVGTITNTGTITSAQGCGIVGSYLLQGATYYAGLTLDNAGEISGASCAISLSGGADTVIIRPGAVLTGSIDGGGVSLTPSGQDKLIFNGFLDADFDNTILKFNLLQATGNADVGLTATDYTFDQVQIDADSSLTFIDTTLTVPSGIINNGALTFNNTALSVPSDIVNNGALTFNNSQTVGNLTNNGSINMDTGTVGTQLTTDDYVSDGVFAMNAALDAGSSSDRLIVTGTLTGSTTLYITNFGGAGAQTTGDGILVVDASGAVITPGASFTLAAPLIAGNYQYTLHQGGIGGNNPQNWYLRSTARSSATAIPTLNPAALVLLALALMAVASRIRNRAR
ncbi:MAG: autotransporter outer membrane beta-barrel domain-containing protein [Proteobacteria bacterium]|nr:autotransporter outer membrane beta-barrel domain-containing protein [Pseudomonadota bacterium]